MSDTKDLFFKRGQLTFRRLKNGGESVYTQLSIDDPEIIAAIEKKTKAGGSPSKILADFIKRAHYAGYKM